MKIRPFTVRVIFLSVASVAILGMLISNWVFVPVVLFFSIVLFVLDVFFYLICYRCPHCGGYLDRVRSDGFCPRCGKPLDIGAAEITAATETGSAVKNAEQDGYVFFGAEYSPGYSDMNGASHRSSLKKDEDDNWIFVTRDREEFGEPDVVVTYEVSENAVEEFIAFINDKKVLDLSNRAESDDFWTDYSPWGYSFKYKIPGTHKTKWYGFGQYKQYSDKDDEILKELGERFNNLRGRQLSQKKEMDA